MTIPDRSTPVLILNAIHYGALGITRSLGRLGVQVYNQAPFRSVPPFQSRYSRRNFVWDHDGAGAEATVEFLVSTAEQIADRALLIPTCDVTAALVADYDDVLRPHFLFPNQRRELVHALCSKRSMYYTAVQHGIDTPKTSFPESVDDVLRFLEAARFPLVLKSIENQLGHGQLRALKVIVKDERELRSLWTQLHTPGRPNLMLQEYIPGDDDANWMFNGYFNENSDCLIGLTGRKLRQFPAYAGVTSLGVCAGNNVVMKTTLAFMKAMGYRGVVDMGYRYDARDGRYKVYDINPRIGATFRLFVDSLDYDVARVLYLDMTNQPVRPGHIREGRRWLVEDSDLLSSLRYHAEGHLTPGRWAASLRGIEEGALFAFDDPLPLGARMVDHARKLFGWHKRADSATRPPSDSGPGAPGEGTDVYAGQSIGRSYMGRDSKDGTDFDLSLVEPVSVGGRVTNSYRAPDFAAEIFAGHVGKGLAATDVSVINHQVAGFCGSYLLRQ